MEKFEVGTVVIIRFPFSNFKSEKIRPALVIGNAEFDNIILCQITSKPYSSKKAITLLTKDFSEGKLNITSYIRPDKIVTVDLSVIKRKVGKIKIKKKMQILRSIRKLFSN